MTDDQREGLQIIARNARVQSELIGDLLDMSRIMAGKMRLNVQQVTLKEVVSAAIDTIKPAAQAKAVLADAGAVRPIIGEVLKFEQAAEAIQKVAGGDTVGRLVVSLAQRG